jgi:subtilisin family serine protease
MSRIDDRGCRLGGAKFEIMESRLVLSTQPWLVADPMGFSQSGPLGEIVALADDLRASQVGAIRADYGFTGQGQTVAIIDSGVAWDHADLGGGYGAGHRVVGGWDFAENDANPYDDGPFGFHGTHVAGIIGNTDTTRYGVASGVDLVALRVFNDSGASDFKWVEQALQWVHQHRNDFAHPITTVNLSLGTRENLTTISSLLSLEDEFAQLKADGIFISVAAGNAFKSFNSVGLTSPAISPHVVPVASHDPNGNLSDFSQRADRVLLAPGRDVVGPVPNHVFMGMQSDGFLAGTGTSMAAPYVAGASALLREAMEFMGRHGVNQDDLYEQFRSTADRVYDSATSRWYHRVNLAAAIDAIVADEFADQAAAATKLGNLVDRLEFRGTIGKTTDVDQLSFTATATGMVTLTLDSTHQLSSLVAVDGVAQQWVGRQITFAVEAGRTYGLTLGTADGIGHYVAELKQSLVQPNLDWGIVDQRTIRNVSVRGEQWATFAAERSAQLTVQGWQPPPGLRFELYDTSYRLVAASQAVGSSLRLDATAAAGQRFHLRLVGSADGLDIRVSNVVSLDAGRLSVYGTSFSDDIRIAFDEQVAVSVNGADYHFSAQYVEQARAFGDEGADRIDVAGSRFDDRFRLSAGRLIMSNPYVNFDGVGFEDVVVAGGGGFDVVVVTDSLGDDRLEHAGGVTSFVGVGFEQRIAADVERTRVISRLGMDQAVLFDSSGDDSIVARAHRSVLRTAQNVVIVEQFDRVVANASRGGFDRARLLDSPGDDRLTLGDGRGAIGSFVSLDGFEAIEAVAGIGSDSVVFQLEPGQQLQVAGLETRLVGAANWTTASGFSVVETNPIGPAALTMTSEATWHPLAGPLHQNSVSLSQPWIVFSKPLGAEADTATDGLPHSAILRREGVWQVVCAADVSIDRLTSPTDRGKAVGRELVESDAGQSLDRVDANLRVDRLAAGLPSVLLSAKLEWAALEAVFRDFDR